MAMVEEEEAATAEEEEATSPLEAASLGQKLKSMKNYISCNQCKYISITIPKQSKEVQKFEKKKTYFCLWSFEK
jgi:hypothetical protein